MKIEMLALANGDYFSDVEVNDDFEILVKNERFIEIIINERKSQRKISINPDFILSYELAI